MAEFGEHLEIDVEDHGLAEAAAEARELAQALQGARDAAAELAGADTGDFAGLAAAKEGAAGLRDDLAEAAAAADGLAASLGAVDAELADADLEQAADDAGELGGVLGELGETMGAIPISPMAAGIGALVAAAAAAAPAVVAVGLGFGSFAALAVPSIEKVKTAYTNLTGAQSAYRQAQQLEARDPTKSNLEAVATALGKLQIAQAAFAKLPPDEQAAVKGAISLKDAFEKLGKSSGIQKDAFGDITKVLGIAKDLLPDVGKLAEAAAPAISRMLGSIEKGVQSKGFQNFISSMSSEVKPAAKALTDLGGAVAGLTGTTLEKLKPISAPFITSLANLTKTLTPATAGALTAGAAALMHVVNAVDKVDKAGQKGGFNKSVGNFVRDSVGAIQWLDSHAGHLDKVAYDRLSHLVPPAHPIKIPVTLKPPSAADINAAMGVHPVKVKVIPASDYTAFDKSLAAHPVSLKIKPVTASDMAAVMGGPGGAGPGGSGGPKVKATAEVTKVDSSHINAAASNVKIHGATVDLANAKLSGLGALSGTLASAGSSAGKAFSHGLSSAVASGGAAAVAAARSAAQGIRGAISGLGGAGQAAGAALGQGMAQGIAASTGAAVAAAHALASAVEAAAKTSLGVSSPSKVFKKIGQETVKGFILGLQGGKSEVAAAMALITGHAAFKDASITETIKKITKEVASAYKDKKIGKGEDSQLTGFIRSDNRRLMALAKQRSDIEKEIRAADALAKSVASSARQGGSIATLQGAMPAGSVSAAGLEQGMTTQLAAIKKFKQELKELKKEGASRSVLRQVAAEGVTQGGAAAQALLAGGKGAIAKISQLQHQIAQAAKGLGKTAANASYESGSQIGKGLAAGLKGELKGVVAAMKDLAKKLVDEIKKALKIHSPSGVMIEIGSAIPAGLAIGIRGSTPTAVGAMHGLASAVTPTAYGHGSGHPNGTSVAPMQHIHVYLDSRQIAQSVQSSSLQRGRRNVAVGLKPANRGA